jgi:DNA-binding CsgD family transcriptional regulator
MDILLIAPSARRRDLLRERLLGAGLVPAAEAAVPSDAEDVAAAVGLADAVPDGPDWMRALMPLQGLAVVGAPPAVGHLKNLALAGWAALPVDVSPTQLRQALEMVDAGFAVAPSDWLRPAPAALTAPRADMDDDLQATSLTDREHDVLDRLAEGLSNQRIADRLGISPHTVKFHIASIYDKLDARTRTQAVRHALDRGVLHL